MNALMIANTQIRRDCDGKYCLNDLHQASGGAQRKQPRYWLANQQTKELVDEVSDSGNPLSVVKGGIEQGTYAVKELVYAYAMWISPRFHLHVIRAYDAMQQAERVGRAPGAGDTAPGHRADVLVGAARGFGALVKAGRVMGLARPHALRAANEATLRATGVDLVQELGADELLQPAAAAGTGRLAVDTVALFHAALQAGELPVPYRPCLTRDAFYLYQHWCHANGHAPDHLPRFAQRLRVDQGVVVDRRRYTLRGTTYGPASVLLWGEPEPSTAGLGHSVLLVQQAVNAVLGQA